MKKIILILLTLSFFFSCNKGKEIHSNFKGLDKNDFIKDSIKTVNLKKSDTEIIKVEKLRTDMVFDISEIEDSVHLIKLETKEECLIGAIDQIKILNEKIFILDKTVTKGIYVFDFKGHFLFKIGQYGKGPGEYLNPYRFQFDKAKNQFVILDRETSKLIYYDLSNGKYLKSYRIGMFSKNFVLEDTNRILYELQRSKINFLKEVDKFSIVRTNDKGELLSGFLPIDIQKQVKFNYTTRESLTVMDGKILAKPNLSNIIYQIDEDDIFPLYQIDFGDRTLPKDFDHNISSVRFKLIYNDQKSKYLIFDGIYLLTSTHLVFRFSDSFKRSYTCIYDLESKRSRIFNKLNSSNFKKGFGSFFPINTYEDFLINYLDSYIILQNKDYFIKNCDEETRKIVLQTTENDNPVLILKTLKKF